MLALLAAPPVCDFGFVDSKPMIIGGIKTGSLAGCTVDVNHMTALPTDEMVMVVIDAIFIQRGRTHGLNSTQHAFVDQGVQRVVHGLSRDGAECCNGEIADLICGGVGLAADRLQNCQSLRSDTEAVLAQLVDRGDMHEIRTISDFGLIPNYCGGAGGNRTPVHQPVSARDTTVPAVVLTQHRRRVDYLVT